uniref:RPA-interacting protein C-terminal domain-containing protein n=1 Tax=Timema bartmani TaxID=61472 RepID=A0A7R9I2B5_9NEOP|nr:unnamed protein product [Timema bartmani]
MGGSGFGSLSSGLRHVRQRIRASRDKTHDNRRQLEDSYFEQKPAHMTKDEKARMQEELSCTSMIRTICLNADEEETFLLSDERLDVRDIELTFKTMEDIEKETLTEEEEWVLKQCETLLNEDAAMLEAVLAAACQGLVCPVCLKGYMSRSAEGDVIHCRLCSASLHWSGSVEEYDRLLHAHLETHNSRCGQKPGLLIVPENAKNKLGILCSASLRKELRCLRDSKRSGAPEDDAYKPVVKMGVHSYWW